MCTLFLSHIDVVVVMGQPVSLSEIELKLLGLLSQNARASSRRIARVSEATIRYHIAKLERMGVIRGYSVIIDPDKLQLPIFVTMGVQCEPARTRQVAASIAKSPYFYLVWIVTGAHNIHAKGAFPNTTEMQRVVEEATSRTSGVISYHLSLMFERVKDPYLLPYELITAARKSKS